MKRALLAFFLAGLAWFGSVALLVVREADRSGSGAPDVAIVLGAALRADGTPSPVFEGRLEHALQLYRQGRVGFLLFTGGRGEGAHWSEAEAARAWAVARGVLPAAILMEERSRTTHQNLQEARALMQAENLRTAFIVSDPLHLPRAMRMARDLGIAAEPSPAPATRFRSASARLPFLARESWLLTLYWLFRV